MHMLKEKFQIKEQIYAGERSVLFRAMRLSDHAKVILKYPKPGLAVNLHSHLEHEYEILRHLAGKGAVQPMELIHTEEGPCLVLPDEGMLSLAQYIRGKNGLPLKELLDFAVQIAHSLYALHQAKVLHKDVNPANICLQPETRELKFIDFEIASQVVGEHQPASEIKSLKGTLAYISPEQTGRMNRPLDHRSDYYSLGVTLYEMATGRLPCSAEDPVELVHFHLAKIPKDPLHWRTDLPPVLGHLIQKLLAKNAEERYQSATGLIHDLERMQREFKLKGTVSDFELGTHDYQGELILPAKLYGREKERQLLLESFSRISHGSKEMLLVSGVSGIGKTNLILEVQKPLAEKYGWFVTGKFDHLHQNVPYASIIQAFSRLIRQVLARSDQEIVYWRLKLERALGENAAVLYDILPDLKHILGEKPKPEELSPQEAHNRFFFSLIAFIRCFAEEDSPLVIFFDDLQWAAKGTLEFIEKLMTDESARHILLIGAYRDAEVSPDHPLTHAIRRYNQVRVNLHKIHLENLHLPHVMELLVDLLGEHPNLKELAGICLEKTMGNPFFLGQFLLTLNQEGYLGFNPNSHQWEYDLQEIAQKESTSNVLDLMVRKLNQFGPATLEMLKLASAFGTYFNLLHLAEVREMEPLEVMERLRQPLLTGLIVAMDDSYKYLADGIDPARVEFRFLHDRVQQAAYLMMGETQKQAQHLRIARTLIKKYGISNERVYDLMTHYNIGREMLEDEIEAGDLMMYNFLAGKKAMYAVAFDHALTYFQTAISMVRPAIWEEDHEFAFELFLNAAEAANMVQKLALMDKWVAELRLRAKNRTEKVKLYEVLIPALVSQSKLVEALKEGLQAVALFGLKLPLYPNQTQVAIEYLKLKQLLWKKKIEDLAQLPEMRDADSLALMRLMGLIGFASYYVSPNLLALLVFKGVGMTVRQGQSPLSSFFFAGFSFILVGPLRELEQGYQVAQVAEEMLRRSGSKKLECKVLLVTSGFVASWKKSLRDVIPAFEYAHLSGVQNGDLEYAATAVPSTIGVYFFSGLPLYEYHGRAKALSPTVLRFKNSPSYNWYRLYGQAVDNLMGLSRDPMIFEGEYFKVSHDLLLLKEAEDHTGFCIYFCLKAMLCYLFNYHEQALEYTQKTAEVIDSQMATVVDMVHHYYNSLILLASYADASASQRKQIVKQVKKNQQLTSQWKQACPANHSHSWYLVEAELALVEGESDRAFHLYDRAVEEAHQNNVPQWVALASERAGQHYQRQGLTKLAKFYTNQAYQSYQQWGALAKCRQMEGIYHEDLIHPAQAKERTSLHSTLQLSEHNLDFISLVRASQALSREVHVKTLVQSLLLLMVQNSGATNGVFMLTQGHSLRTLAQFKAGHEGVEVIEPVAVENYPHVPLSVINQCRRLQQPILVEDMTEELIFHADPYFATRQVHSLLACPVLQQGYLVGMVYLENGLQPHVLNQERLGMIEVLATQAGISLENAKLYETLEEKVQERTAALNHSLAKVEEANRDILDSMGYAKLIQESLLPNPKSLAQHLPNHFVIWQPRDLVGGDLYFFEERENRMVIGLMDCTGHGVPGALMTMVAASGLKELLSQELLPDPGSLLRGLDAWVKQSLNRNRQAGLSDDGLDVAVLMVDFGQRKLCFAGANLSLILYRDGQCEVLKGDRQSLGYATSPSQFPFLEHWLEWDLETSYYLFSDGMQDQVGGIGYPAGRRRLMDWLKKSACYSLPEQGHALLNEFVAYQGEEPRRDDVTVVGFNFQGNPRFS